MLILTIFGNFLEYDGISWNMFCRTFAISSTLGTIRNMHITVVRMRTRDFGHAENRAAGRSKSGRAEKKENLRENAFF